MITLFFVFLCFCVMLLSCVFVFLCISIGIFVHLCISIFVFVFFCVFLLVYLSICVFLFTRSAAIKKLERLHSTSRCSSINPVFPRFSPMEKDLGFFAPGG